MLAYLDPGLGAMILSTIVGIAATLALGARLFWHSIVSFFRAPRAAPDGSATPADQPLPPRPAGGLRRGWSEYRRFRQLAPELRNVVFYSESRQDWHHFEPIIEHLCGALSRTVCYVTSDPLDADRQRPDGRLLTFHVPEGLLRMLLFKFMRADVLVLTMTDLDNLQLKRSMHPVHYAYLFHAMGSTHMVDLEDAYDHYDSVFCVGPHQVREIRRREERRGLPAKHLFEHGYGRLDHLMEVAGNGRAGSPSEPATVLVAPTWGHDTILPLCGRDLVAGLLDAGHRVVLRPHYHTRKTTPQVIESIVREFENHPLFAEVSLMGEEDSLLDSSVLVTDWSSIAIEYALGLGKPVLFIDVPARVRNPRFEELGIEPAEMRIRRQVGSVLDAAKVREAPEHVARLLEGAEAFRERLPELREEWVFHPGRSAEVAAREIARIAGEKRLERAV